MGEKVQRVRSVDARYKIDGEVNTMGNGEANELTCMTHVYELRWRNADGMGSTG